MPRFSIVMTTTDRPNLLPAGVRAVLEMDFRDFELVVSDNFSKIPAAEILKDVKDERLRIIRTDRRLAVSDHWEFAWEHLRGDFVTYLGDDNALRPDILTLADRAIRNYDLDIMAWRVCTYFHPDWNVDYGALPKRGNVLFIDLGTTQKLYRCHPDAVLGHFCQHLRTYGCFACMVNCVFRKSIGDKAREKAGRLFLIGLPETSSSVIVLGMARPDRYAFFDGFGGIAGRSGDSAFAAMLSRGKASRRYEQYMAEFGGRDFFPGHEPKFVAISNLLASVVTQARNLLPEYFQQYDFDRTMLARKTIDDLYVDRTEAGVDDPAFMAQVEKFIQSLPPPAAAEIFAYRDECRARNSAAAQPAAGTGAGPDNSRGAILELVRKARQLDKALAWRLFRETGRNPWGRYWMSGGTTCIDMSLYDCHDIADTARNFGRVLTHFDRYDQGFANYYRQLGMLSETLDLQPGAAVAKVMAAAE
jgi:glycosyltransferase involved in cell wall biosynthesis